MTVPKDISAKVLFLSDRTCCVCCIKGKPIQIHHIDGDDTNNEIDNLATLCLGCHNETQIRGGFHRKLGAELIKLYRDNWYSVVSSKRTGDIKSSIVQSENKDKIRWQILGPKSIPDPIVLKSERLKTIPPKYLDSWMLDVPITFPIKFIMTNFSDESINRLTYIRSTTQAIVFNLVEPIRKWEWKPFPHRKLHKISKDIALRTEVPEKGQNIKFTFDAIYRPRLAMSPFLKRAVLNYEFDGRTPSGTKFVGGPYRIEIPIKGKSSSAE